MPRRPRIQLADIPQHLVQRGVNREPCFFAEQDYHCYLHWLKEAAADWRCPIHAYVLMTNHVHLLATPQSSDGAAKLMQSVGRRYVQYINREYRRTGTLWEGRFKSSAVRAEEYFLLCQRYVELNPVRANMVDDPAHYRRSSYRHYALGEANDGLNPHALYLALGSDAAARQAAYRALFRTEPDHDALADIRLATSQSQPLGTEKFREAISKAAGVRLARPNRGRPEGRRSRDESMEEQTEFGF